MRKAYRLLIPVGVVGLIGLGIVHGDAGKNREPAQPTSEVAVARRPVPDALRSAPHDELAFVPLDAEAIVRVDLAQVGVRSDKPAQSLKMLDFLLKQQQPAAWELLHNAGITIGKELETLYLVVGPQGGARDMTLIAGLGRFDIARLGAGLRRANAAVEAAAAPRGQTAAVFRWKQTTPQALGALESPSDSRVATTHADAVVGVGQGIILFGPRELVRRALAARAGVEADVRASDLADEILAVDASATVWGVALPASGVKAQPFLPTLLPGVRRARFQAALASPGPEIDGLFSLRAEFASGDQAAAFQGQLTQLLQTVALLGERSPLGTGFAKLKAQLGDGKVVKRTDNVIVASAAL